MPLESYVREMEVTHVLHHFFTRLPMFFVSLFHTQTLEFLPVD